MLSGFCPNPAIPSTQDTKKPSFTKVPPPPPTCSFARSRNWVCHRAFVPISRRTRFRKKIQCRNNAVEVVGVTSDEDFTSGVRRKKLAVFVSGGGSNFRSIHEASLLGSIHGDIVVLVTDKQGIVLCLCSFAVYLCSSMTEFSKTRSCFVLRKVDWLLLLHIKFELHKTVIQRGHEFLTFFFFLFSFV